MGTLTELHPIRSARRNDHLLDVGFGLLGVLLIVALLCLSGCSTARLRIGPIGAGIATTVNGPGLEAALSDKNGTPVLAGSASVNLPALLADIWQFVQAHLPKLGASLLSTAPVPTGPPPGVV